KALTKKGGGGTTPRRHPTSARPRPCAFRCGSPRKKGAETMSSTQILVIDDEPALRQILLTVLTRAGYSVDLSAGVAEARTRLARADVDVALCDITMQDGNGIDLLPETRAAGVDTVFVMITGSSSVATVVEALRAGAFDYLTKPVRNEELLHRLAQIDAMRGLREGTRP